MRRSHSEVVENPGDVFAPEVQWTGGNRLGGGLSGDVFWDPPAPFGCALTGPASGGVPVMATRSSTRETRPLSARPNHAKLVRPASASKTSEHSRSNCNQPRSSNRYGDPGADTDLSIHPDRLTLRPQSQLARPKGAYILRPMNAAERFFAASSAHDAGAAIAELAADVVMLNPATDDPIVGKAAVAGALGAVEAACDEF